MIFHLRTTLLERTDISTLQKVQRRVTKMVRDLSLPVDLVAGSKGDFQDTMEQKDKGDRDSICSVSISNIFPIETE